MNVPQTIVEFAKNFHRFADWLSGRHPTQLVPPADSSDPDMMVALPHHPSPDSSQISLPLIGAKEPLVLFSCNPWLAFMIAQHYYQNRHYVTCIRYFDQKSVPRDMEPLPPACCPADIYHTMNAELNGGGSTIKTHPSILGILVGAKRKREAGLITEVQEQEINSVVAAASPLDFRPLLYVIPFKNVKDLVERIPLNEKVTRFHEEYRIPALPRKLFEVLDLRRS